jgi:WD40 repeat protein
MAAQSRPNQKVSTILIASGIALLIAAVAWLVYSTLPHKNKPTRPRDTVIWKISHQDTYDVFYSVYFNPDGSQMLTRCGSRVCVWGTGTGELVGDLGAPASASSSAPADIGPVYSPDGKLIAVPGKDKAVIIQAETGEEVLTLAVPDSVVYSAWFNPEKPEIVTAGSDQVARVWDSRSGEEIAHWQAGRCSDTWGCWTAAFYSHDGASIVTTGADHGVRLWNAETGGLIREFAGHDAMVISADFSSDDSMLVTAGWDHTVKVWDVNSGNVLRSFPDMGWVMRAVFSPDDRFIAAVSWSGVTGWGDHTTALFLLDVETGELVYDYPEYSKYQYGIDFHPNGMSLAVAGDNHLVLYSLAEVTEAVPNQ